jgi:hypothetical protein
MQNAECRMKNPERVGMAALAAAQVVIRAFSGLYILHSAFCIRITAELETCHD